MQVTVFTRHRDFGRALADASTLPKPTRAGDRFEIGPLQRVPGATDRFWQLAVDIGLMSAPIGIACNLIASWLYDAFTRWKGDRDDAGPSCPRFRSRD